MSADFDLDLPPRHVLAPDAPMDRVPVMWPQHVLAHTVPDVPDGVSPGTAAAVILACVGVGGATALIFRDAILALLAS